MAEDGAPLISKVLGAKIRIVLREIPHQAEAERGLVARRRYLRGIGKAGSIGIGGAAHAECPRRAGHARGKGGFGAAEIFGDRGGDIIGGLHHQRLDGGFDRNRLTRPDAQFRRRHGGGPR